MTDKELLEAAAKAAGITGPICEMLGGGYYIASKNVPLGMWAPLSDNGDALWLAVKLGFGVHQVQNPVTGSPGYVSIYTGRGQEHVDEAYFHSDPYAATRRAIVRAAAAIQSTKPASDTEHKERS